MKEFRWGDWDREFANLEGNDVYRVCLYIYIAHYDLHDMRANPGARHKKKQITLLLSTERNKEMRPRNFHLQSLILSLQGARQFSSNSATP